MPVLYFLVKPYNKEISSVTNLISPCGQGNSQQLLLCVRYSSKITCSSRGSAPEAPAAAPPLSVSITSLSVFELDFCVGELCK